MTHEEWRVFQLTDMYKLSRGWLGPFLANAGINIQHYWDYSEKAFLIPVLSTHHRHGDRQLVVTKQWRKYGRR